MTANTSSLQTPTEAAPRSSPATIRDTADLADQVSAAYCREIASREVSTFTRDRPRSRVRRRPAPSDASLGGTTFVDLGKPATNGSSNDRDIYDRPVGPWRPKSTSDFRRSVAFTGVDDKTGPNIGSQATSPDLADSHEQSAESSTVPPDVMRFRRAQQALTDFHQLQTDQNLDNAITALRSFQWRLTSHHQDAELMEWLEDQRVTSLRDLAVERDEVKALKARNSDLTKEIRKLTLQNAAHVAQFYEDQSQIGRREAEIRSLESSHRVLTGRMAVWKVEEAKVARAAARAAARSTSADAKSE